MVCLHVLGLLCLVSSNDIEYIPVVWLFWVCLGFYLLSSGSSIFCFYKSTVKQILCQSTTENKDHRVKSYHLIRAAMRYVGGGSISSPHCKERLQAGGKSQPSMKSQNLWLHPVFPHSTSWIDLWPLLLLSVPGCAYSLQSPSGAGAFVLASCWRTSGCWEKSLSVTILVAHYLLIQLSGHIWFSTVFLFGTGERWRMLHVTYFSGP